MQNASHRHPAPPRHLTQAQIGRLTADWPPAASPAVTLESLDIGPLPDAPDEYDENHDYYQAEVPYLTAQVRCMQAILAAARQTSGNGHLVAHIEAVIAQLAKVAGDALDGYENDGGTDCEAMRATLHAAVQPVVAAPPKPSNFPFTPVLLAGTHRSIYNRWVRVCDKGPNHGFKALVVQQRALLDWSYLA